MGQPGNEGEKTEKLFIKIIDLRTYVFSFPWVFSGKSGKECGLEEIWYLLRLAGDIMIEYQMRK